MTEVGCQYHVPVMLAEAIEGLRLREDGTFVDVTFGGGGHSKAILERLGPWGVCWLSTRTRMLWHGWRVANGRRRARLNSR